jgi:hypothetical protein
MEELNLCELLKDCVGMKLYSTILGNVKITGVQGNYISFVSEKTRYSGGVSKSGKHWDDEYGECTLFPSKENRDWSKFIKPLKKDSMVMASNEGMSRFVIRFYSRNNLCFADGSDSKAGVSEIEWKWIVSIEEYDVNASFEENIKKSIV